MDYFITINLPIPASDLFTIQKMLEDDDIICSAFKPDLFNVYFIGSYIKEQEIHGTKIKALIDRNIFTDIVSLALGEEISPSSVSKKMAAALMAFFQCGDVLIETNIALYEYASMDRHLMANKELCLFRFADNMHPKFYADIALNREKKLKKKGGKFEIRSKFFGKRIGSWDFNYTLVLKLALIELEQIEQFKKMTKFMKWMFDEFYFGSPAVLFANRYFSKKARLKGLKSFDRKLALSSIKNKTWDLTILSEWARNTREQRAGNTIWLLCSRDKELMRIARCLMVSGHSEISLKEERVKNEFIHNWGSKRGCDLYALYEDFRQRIEDKSRVANKGFPPEYFEEIRLGFEKELLISENRERFPIKPYNCGKNIRQGRRV